jgi:hypothetical protein
MEEKLETFVIMSKTNEPERYKNFLTQVVNNKLHEFLNIHYFNQCWKNDITPEIREKYCKSDWAMRKHGRNMINKPLTSGEISLFLNYIECLKIIRKKYEKGLFLLIESDTIFKNNFNKKNIMKITNDVKTIEDLDILNIGTGVEKYFRCRGYPRTQPIIYNKNKYYKENLNKGMEGVIWTYKSICKFLKYFEEKNDIDGPIDTKIDVLSQHLNKFNIYWSETPLLFGGSTNNKYFQRTLN